MADACGPTPPSPPVENKTGRTVFCTKFQKDLPGLDAPPWPGELGQRIYETVSAQAWKLWEERMKMILNEYRLMPWQKEAQDLIEYALLVGLISLVAVVAIGLAGGSVNTIFTTIQGKLASAV